MDSNNNNNNNNHNINLDAISEMMSPMTVSSSLLFEGQINRSRFIESLKNIAKYCPWIGSSFQVNDGKVSLIPRNDEKNPELNPDEILDLENGGYVTCEYTDSSSIDYESSIPMTSTLPAHTHIKMTRIDLALASVDGLPITAFKLTQYKNHFVLGYRLNHAFFDQGAIVYFFTFLSKLYSNPSRPEDLSVPNFLSRSHLVPPHANFDSDEEFVKAAPRGYCAEPMPPLSFGVPLSLELQFNIDKIEEFRGENGISTNDILHAILVKALANYHHELAANTEEKIRLLYARNMRPVVSVPSNTVGDYIRLECFDGKLKDFVDSDLLRIAQQNRSILNSQTNIDLIYSRECQWFLQYGSYRTGRPNSDFLNDTFTAVVTNWSSFPYENISFDSAIPCELLLEGAPMMTGTGAFVRVSFRGKRPDRQIIAVLNTLYAPLIECVRKYSEETELFSCH